MGTLCDSDTKAALAVFIHAAAVNNARLSWKVLLGALLLCSECCCLV